MGIYTPTIFPLPNGLDEVGLRLGLQRITPESLSDYRRRLLLETRDRSDATQHGFIKSVNRKVAEFEIPVFEIDLILDANGEPVAADPFIEITSTYIRAYSDYENGTLDFEGNLTDRDDLYFLRDVKAQFDASSYFSLTLLDSGHTYRRSDHLMFGHTRRFSNSKFLLESYENNIGKPYISKAYFSNTTVFEKEVSSLTVVAEDGDYYVDYTNGVVFSHLTQTGYMYFVYNAFPYIMKWQPVRAYPYADEDLKYLHKDKLIDDDTGTSTPVLLNQEGAFIANKVLGAHPLGYGS